MNNAAANAWTPIDDAFPTFNQPVLVSGRTESPDQPGAVHVVARLVEAGEASDAEGRLVETWADEEFGDELPFDVTHWRALTAEDAALA